MFGKAHKPEGPLWELRDSLLSDPPAELVAQVAPGTSVWGSLMETGYPAGAVTLIALGEGSTSLYLPTGGGIIGVGQHVSVRAAATAFLITADAMRAALAPATDHGFPPEGRVRFYVLATDGVLTAECDEQAAGTGTGPLSAIFHAGHAVIAQMRMVTQGGEEHA